MLLSCSGGDDTSAILACNHAVGTTHALFLTYTLGSLATITTSAIILSADFLINLFIIAQIIYQQIKNPSELKESILHLQILVINELVEFMVPISYTICFVSAYFGPNSGLQGNSVVSNANFSSIERVRAPVFEYFRARTSPSIRYSNIFKHIH